MAVPFLTTVQSDPFPKDHQDVVIVGGGIAGISTALFLAERGLRVTICEKGQISGEQSSRNWGFVRQMGRDPAELPLAMRSLSLWRKLDKRFGAQTGFRQTGILFATENDARAEELHKWQAIGNAKGLDCRALDATALQTIVGNQTHPFVMGLHTPGDGRAEPGLAVPALAEAARRLGANIMANTSVRGVEQSAGRVAGVVTEHGTIPCNHTVIAAGVWSRRFLHPLGIEFPQLPLLASVARIETSAPLPKLPFANDEYAIRHREDGGYTIALRNANIAHILPDSIRLMSHFLPALRKTWREVRLRFGLPFFRDLAVRRQWTMDQQAPFERERVLDPEPRVAYARQALRRLSVSFPAARDARVTHDWGGMIDATPDALPVIDHVGTHPGLSIISGFSGHGFGVGPGAGELMADLITGQSPKVDPVPFLLDRFYR